MARVQVDNPSIVGGIGAVIEAQLSDWRRYWELFEARLPDVQDAWWDDRFNVGVVHSEATLKARQRRQGYYRHPPGERRRYLEWTGSLRRATEVLTEKRSLAAIINTAESYNGPITNLDDPVSTLFGKIGASPWSREGLDLAAEDALEEWTQDLVDETARVVRRST